MQIIDVSKNQCKPFLRWAGGKTWLIKHISDNLLKIKFNSYHEPFLGGGSLFFHLEPKNGAYLSDLNHELIDTYIQVQKNVEDVIEKLSTFQNSKEFYYYLRDSNPYKSPTELAARFIYLNQTSFNGIYRVNLQGRYNVPYGFRSIDFFNPENLRQVSNALKNVKFLKEDFGIVLNNVNENDLVFLDPPYTVTHNENGFIKYNNKLFSQDDQIRLSDTINIIKEKGAFYILTNAAHKYVKEVFVKEKDKLIEVERASLIGGKNAKRGRYKEYLFTNINL